VSRRAQVAYKNNFEALFVAQHYATGPDTAILQSLPLLAYLAGQVPGMYLGTSIFLLPLHPPLMVAEYTATLDNLCGGKFLFGVGQGYREIEFMSFGVEKRHRRNRLVEALQVIRKLWSEDEVTFHGRFFQLDGVTIAPKPLQQPGPPILVGADTVTTVAKVPEVADHWIASRRHSKAFLREAVPETGSRSKGFSYFAISASLIVQRRRRIELEVLTSASINTTIGRGNPENATICLSTS